MPTGVAAVCESVAVRATARVVDTTARVGPYWDEQQHSMTSSEIHGCATVAEAPEGLNRALYAGLYWKDSVDRGWALLPECDADGPDGNSLTRRRGDIMCQVARMESPQGWTLLTSSLSLQICKMPRALGSSFSPRSWFRQATPAHNNSARLWRSSRRVDESQVVVWPYVLESTS